MKVKKRWFECETREEAQKVLSDEVDTEILRQLMEK